MTTSTNVNVCQQQIRDFVSSMSALLVDCQVVFWANTVCLVSHVLVPGSLTRVWSLVGFLGESESFVVRGLSGL